MKRLAYLICPWFAAVILGGCSYATKIPGVKSIPGIKKIPGMEKAVEDSEAEGGSAPVAANGIPYVSDRPLEVGDVLEVAVYKGLRSSDDIFDEEVTVGGDGTVKIGEIGNPKVGGVKVSDAVGRIGAAFLRSAATSGNRVTVHIPKVNGTKVIRVSGGVARPGAFPLQSGMTVKEAIAQAGGKRAGAGKSFIYVTSRGVRKTLILDGMEEKDLEGKTKLRAGDVVEVPVGY